MTFTFLQVMLHVCEGMAVKAWLSCIVNHYISLCKPILCRHLKHYIRYLFHVHLYLGIVLHLHKRERKPQFPKTISKKCTRTERSNLGGNSRKHGIALSY